MAQITVRLGERLADDLKRQAALQGRSVNGFVVAVLEAAVDPDFEEAGAARTRARLARAGLLAEPTTGKAARPDERQLKDARRAAGRGTSLSDLVVGGRG